MSEQHHGSTKYHPSALASFASAIPRAMIRGYQMTLGPFLGGRCRFYPSCSNYALEAFAKHPPHTAAWLTGKRLCRCHPFGGHGVDLVPEGKGSNRQVAKE